MLGMAAAFNLNVWTFHFIKIGWAAIQVDKKRKVITVPGMLIHAFTVIYLIVIVLQTVNLFLIASKNTTEKEDEEVDRLMLYQGINFTLMGLGFGVVGVLINYRLAVFFADFYKENIKTLWFSTLGLSLPLMTRGILDLVRLYFP